MTSHPGRFIVFEGGEGVGKTTQIETLTQVLRSHGHDPITTREPGGSHLGTRIRALLLDPDVPTMSARTEALLFAADRAEHVETVIRPALDRGQCVISDRYMDSSAAYQSSGRGLDRDEVLALSKWATTTLLPDLTIVLDADPAIAHKRLTTTEFGTQDRIEAEGLRFARNVRAGFLAMAAADPDRYLVVDATAPLSEVTATVQSHVLALLGSLHAPEATNPARTDVA